MIKILNYPGEPKFGLNFMSFDSILAQNDQSEKYRGVSGHRQSFDIEAKFQGESIMVATLAQPPNLY